MPTIPELPKHTQATDEDVLCVVNNAKTPGVTSQVPLASIKKLILTDPVVDTLTINKQLKTNKVTPIITKKYSDTGKSFNTGINAKEYPTFSLGTYGFKVKPEDPWTDMTIQRDGNWYIECSTSFSGIFITFFHKNISQMLS